MAENLADYAKRMIMEEDNKFNIINNTSIVPSLIMPKTTVSVMTEDDIKKVLLGMSEEELETLGTSIKQDNEKTLNGLKSFFMLMFEMTKLREVNELLKEQVKLKDERYEAEFKQKVEEKVQGKATQLVVNCTKWARKICKNGADTKPYYKHLMCHIYTIENTGEQFYSIEIYDDSDNKLNSSQWHKIIDHGKYVGNTELDVKWKEWKDILDFVTA